MAVLTPPSQEHQQVQEWPLPRLWTIEEYERAGELGIFGEDERLELLEGEIVQKMSPQRSPHAASIDLVSEELRSVFGKEVRVRVQVPFNIGQRSQPEPDVYVVRGGVRDFVKAHPRSALLVVEIADTTLRADLGRKALLYARAGVPEYWVMDLNIGELIVHRDPVEDVESITGHRYSTITKLHAGDKVTPLLANREASVSNLLP